MGCKQLKYQNFSFLEIVHSKKRVSAEKKRINYYPFGLKHKGYNNVINGTDHKYGYGGSKKEEQDELGLNWIDFGFRNYDASIGRWMNIDPLAEEYFNLSPYNYVSNTPLMAIDPNGLEIIIIGNKKYTQQVLNYLGSLGSSSSLGAQLVYKAITSKKKFIIYDPKEKNSSPHVSSDSEGEYSTLNFDVSSAEGELDADNGRNGESLKKTGETTLAHELSHFNNSNDDTGKIDGTNINSNEVDAVKEENQVRREMGLPERTHYGGVNVYGKQAQKNSNGQNSRLAKSKSYNVNVNGIGKRTFQYWIKNAVITRYEKVNDKVYRGGRILNRMQKGPVPKKQLTVNETK